MEFKTEEVKEGYESVHPIVKELCETINRWSLAYDKKPITITDSLSTPERDKLLKRESPAHSQARAVDIRCNDWTTQKITLCVHYFNEKYGKTLGYIRLSNKQRILMYLHGEKENLHIHTAIGIDVIEKYKNSYPNWSAPTYTKKAVPKIIKPKEAKNGK